MTARGWSRQSPEAMVESLNRAMTGWATIAGFGKFVIRSRAARRGRNPQTGEPVAIVASRVPSFKAAKALRDAVNG